jgi:cob(I)alamin adenosyltransferase
VSKIYTKTGDSGTTGLLGGGRASKDDLRIDAYGTVDELNAAIGLVRASGLDTETDSLLARIQDDLFAVGSALADPNPTGPFHGAIDADHTIRLEAAIDKIEAELPPLTRFILPGGTIAAAQVQLARAICRRAERLTVKLACQQDQHVSEFLVVYLNRLSDLLFVVSRRLNHRAGVPDTTWRGL